MTQTTKDDNRHVFEIAGLGTAPYAFLDVIDFSDPFALGASMPNREHYRKLGAQFGSCAYCGRGLTINCVVESEETGRVFVVGSDCVRKAGDAGLMRNIKAARKALKADRIRNARTVARTAQLSQEVLDALQIEHRIISDVRERFLKTGRISDKQIALVLKIANEIKNPPPAKPTTPVVEGKGVTISGVLISRKTVESEFGVQIKMLVEDDRGFRVYGTQPSQLYVVGCAREESSIILEVGVDGKPSVYARNIKRGDRVTFVANVERSSKDEAFGFFKRPRKAVAAKGAE